MSEVLYLHQNFTDCISNQYRYVKMPDVTASYGTLLERSITIDDYSSSPNFHRLCVTTISITKLLYHYALTVDLFNILIFHLLKLNLENISRIMPENGCKSRDSSPSSLKAI